MKRLHTFRIAAACIAVWLLVSATVAAQSAAEKPPAESWESAPISLQSADVTIKDVLMDLARQAGVGLAVTASPEEMNRPLTLMVKKRPAKEVIDIIRDASPNIKITFKNDMLVVSAVTPPPPPTEDKMASAPPASDMDSDSIHLPQNWRQRWKRWADNNKERKKERVEFGKSLTVGVDETYKTAVAIGGDNTVYGHIFQDAVSVGGNLVIKSGSVVEGSAVSVGGSVVIEPGASVEDDAVSVGGALDISDQATLGGSRVSIGVPIPSMTGAAGVVGGMAALYIIGAIIRTVMLLALALLLLWLMPKRLETIGNYISARPGLSTLSGLLIFVAMIPVFAVLGVSIIGIPLIPVAVLFVIAMVVVGHTAIMGLVGQRVPLLRADRLSVKAIILGFIVFLILNLIPFLGALFFFVVTMVGVGAAFQTRFGGRAAL